MLYGSLKSSLGMFYAKGRSDVLPGDVIGVGIPGWHILTLPGCTARAVGRSAPRPHTC